MAERRSCSRCERQLWHAGNHSWLGTMCISCGLLLCEDCQQPNWASPCRQCGNPVVPAEDANLPSRQRWLSLDVPPFSPESLPTNQPKKAKVTEVKLPEPPQKVQKQWWQVWKSTNAQIDNSSVLNEQALRNLFVDLASGDSAKVSAAYQEIVMIGAPAINGCVNFLKSISDDYQQKLVAEILGEIGTSKAVTPLVSLIEHPKLMVRLSAIRSLSQITERESVAALNLMLNHRISDVKDNAFTALNRIEHQLKTEQQ